MYNTMKNTVRRFRKDSKGHFAAIWALSAGAVVLTVGSTYDVNQVSKARQMAQLAADNMALTASIAIDFDNADKFIEGQAYSYQYLGGPSKDFTDSMQGVVEYDIADDKDPQRDENGVVVRDENGNIVYNKLIARSTVTGTYKTAFMGMMGYDEIEFKASSDVAYAAKEGTPASVFFVTDNSGSMGGYDNNGVRKISSLKTSMREFMDALGNISHGQPVFRTALFPYNYYLIHGKKVDPKWHALTDNSINLMSARGGTRSTAALTRAKDKFHLENTAHYDEHGNDSPLKFLVFMSDGANNGIAQRRVCEVDDVWVPGTAAYWWRWRYSWRRGWYKRTSTTRPTRNKRQWRYVPATQGRFESQQVCDWETYSPVNNASLTQCEFMKEQQKVVIYSIAYDVNARERQMAEDFMKKCSSNTDVDGNYVDNGYYKYATTGADLEQIFDAIGQSIVSEVIRLKH